MLLVAALIAGLAPAPSRSVELRWSAPPTQCPDRAAVERELEALDGNVRLDPDAPILVDAVVTLQDEGFVLDIQFTGPGERPPQQLYGRSCETLARATALITLDVASTAAQREPKRETATQPETATPLVPQPETAPQREPELQPETTQLAQPTLPEPARTPDGRLVLTLATGPWLGLLSTPAATLLARAGWKYGRWMVEGSGGHAFRTTESVAGPAELSVRLTYGGLRGCYALANGKRLSVSGCLGIQMGSLYSEPNDDVSFGVRNRGLWIGATGGAVLAWQIRPRFSLALEGIAIAHARRPGVYWNIGPSQETVFRASLASGAVLFGPRLHLP